MECEIVNHDYEIGSVISSLLPLNSGEKPMTLSGKINITHHQDAIFIIAPNKPTYTAEYLRRGAASEKLIKECGLSGDTVITLDLRLETYIKLGSLPKELQKSVREFIKNKTNSSSCNEEKLQDPTLYMLFFKVLLTSLKNEPTRDPACNTSQHKAE